MQPGAFYGLLESKGERRKMRKLARANGYGGHAGAPSRRRGPLRGRHRGRARDDDGLADLQGARGDARVGRLEGAEGYSLLACDAGERVAGLDDVERTARIRTARDAMGQHRELVERLTRDDAGRPDAVQALERLDGGDRLQTVDAVDIDGVAEVPQTHLENLDVGAVGRAVAQNLLSERGVRDAGGKEETQHGAAHQCCGERLEQHGNPLDSSPPGLALGSDQRGWPVASRRFTRWPERSPAHTDPP